MQCTFPIFDAGGETKTTLVDEVAPRFLSTDVEKALKAAKHPEPEALTLPAGNPNYYLTIGLKTIYYPAN